MTAQDPTGKDSIYAKPELVPAGKDGKDRPTFYMVVNQHGLDALHESGLLSDAQRKRIREEFEPRLTDKAEQPADAKSDPTLFIVEVKKDGDTSKATRVCSGVLCFGPGVQNEQWLEVVEDKGKTAEFFVTTPNHIDIDKTLNLVSPGLPSQSVQIQMTLGNVKPMRKDDFKKNGLPLQHPTEENAQEFKKAVEVLEKEGKIAHAGQINPAMRAALAQAVDPDYVPIANETVSVQPSLPSVISKTSKSAA